MRGVVKGNVTKLEQWLDSDADDGRDQFDLEARLESLENFMITFDKHQTELEQIDTAEEAERMEFDERVMNLKAKFKRARFNMSGHSSTVHDFHDANASRNSVGPANNSYLHVEVTSSTDVPLPKLPVFSGEDYLAYPKFINQFKALVDDNYTNGLTGMKKFSILKGALTGVALESIDHLVMTHANYDIALKILNDRFHK